MIMFVSLFVVTLPLLTDIYSLSLHDALPISFPSAPPNPFSARARGIASGPEVQACLTRQPFLDRKSTRLNSSHANISYAVFCLEINIPAMNVLLYLYLSVI